MRFAIPAVLFFLSVAALPVRATGFDDKIPDQQSIDALAAQSQSGAAARAMLSLRRTGA